MLFFHWVALGKKCLVYIKLLIWNFRCLKLSPQLFAVSVGVNNRYTAKSKELFHILIFPWRKWINLLRIQVWSTHARKRKIYIWVFPLADILLQALKSLYQRIVSSLCKRTVNLHHRNDHDIKFVPFWAQSKEFQKLTYFSKRMQKHLTSNYPGLCNPEYNGTGHDTRLVNSHVFPFWAAVQSWMHEVMHPPPRALIYLDPILLPNSFLPPQIVLASPLHVLIPCWDWVNTLGLNFFSFSTHFNPFLQSVQLTLIPLGIFSFHFLSTVTL